MIAFLISYLVIVGAVVLSSGAFFAVVGARNRTVTTIAEGANIFANPLATVAANIRDFSAMAFSAVPETSFSSGVVRRVVYGFTFVLLAGADFALAAGRLAVAFGVQEQSLPFDLSWMTALAWVLTAGFFAAMSFELRMDPVGHPWDQLPVDSRKLFRRISDVLLVATALSAVVFYVYGALATVGSYDVLLVLVFMGLLGLVLTIAAGVSFWACMDCWATLYGVVLVVAGLIIRIFAVLPELLVIAIRRSAYLTMATVDMPALGVAMPMVTWLAKSRMGKTLGVPVPEEPIAWPAVGYVEPPAAAVEHDADRKVRLAPPAPLRETLLDDDEEEAA